MSLNNIQLPAIVLQELYQKSLVDPEGNKPLPTTSTGKELNFFGGNKQHIILLVNSADTAFIEDEQLTFLSGILAACKLTLEDIGLLNTATYPSISYKKISEIFTPRIIIMFGILPEAIQLPFVMPEFQSQSYNNQVYVAAPPLTEIENNKDLKRKLWMVLQQIFFL